MTPSINGLVAYICVNPISEKDISSFLDTIDSALPVTDSAMGLFGVFPVSASYFPESEEAKQHSMMTRAKSQDDGHRTIFAPRIDIARSSSPSCWRRLEGREPCSTYASFELLITYVVTKCMSLTQQLQLCAATI